MIDSVKIQKNGFLVNGVLSVPNDEGNRHFNAVQDWIEAGNIPAPEFTQSELDKQAIDSINASAKEELAAIDRASVRAIREYIASKPDAPKMLIDRELEAVFQRAKIK